MLKHKKRIIIRNVRLRKIRNSLREFFIKIVYDEIEILRNFASLYDDWTNITIEEENEFSQLQATKINLFHLISKSICSCPLCTNTDKNMLFIPDHETWYCIECQEKGFIWDLSHGSEEDILNQDYVNFYFEQKEKFAKSKNNDDNLNLG